MYRIFIVDDEPQILEGLKHIIDWDEHGIEIAGQARNGMEALEMLASMNVHILLTDIRMPKMNGLELIKQIKQKGWRIRSIILSGFDDFEYIKEAVKLGIENYILKPVDKEELSSTLLNTIEKIESDLYRHINERQGLNIFYENILYLWLSNNISNEELLEKAPLVNLNLKSEEYAVAIVKVLYKKNFDEESAANQNLMNFAVRNICNELAGEGELAAVFTDLNGDIVLLFPGNSSYLEKQKIIGILESCIASINQFLNLDVFVSVGSVEKGYRSAHKSYSTSKDLQAYSLIMPKNSIIDYGEVAKNTVEREAKVNIDFEAFDYLLKTRMYEDCARFIDESFDRICAIKGITPVFIQNFAIEILYHISNSLKRFSQDNKYDDVDLSISFSDVYKIRTIEELKYWLKLILKETIEVTKSYESEYSPLIKQVLSYIQKNYNKDISIKILSSIFNINAAYLGQLFKKETGEMLTNYVNNIRIEKAKEMLLNTSMKASEISEKVGYVNTNYFYRIFKKITGVSPTEFR